MKANMILPSSSKLTRRVLITAAQSALATPYLWPRRASAAQQVIVRSSGGESDDVKRDVIFEPFLRETGIEVVPVAASSARMIASVRAGRVEIDVNDNGADSHARMARLDALEPILYQDFKYTDPADIDAALRRPFYVGQGLYSTIIGFNTGVVPVGQEPRSWAEFWDIKRFPGPRSLADLYTDTNTLEVALLADGVAADKLYPLDTDRAFASLSRIRSAVPKFWSSGAMSAQLLTDDEVNMGSIWSTRLGVAASRGAPVAGQWNQNLVSVQAYGILKNAPNMTNAIRFIDFALQPEVQAKVVQRMPMIPSNQKSYAQIPSDLIDPATGTPWTSSKGVRIDVDWWIDNVRPVFTAWSKWIRS